MNTIKTFLRTALSKFKDFLKIHMTFIVMAVVCMIMFTTTTTLLSGYNRSSRITLAEHKREKICDFIQNISLINEDALEYTIKVLDYSADKGVVNVFYKCYPKSSNTSEEDMLTGIVSLQDEHIYTDSGLIYTGYLDAALVQSLAALWYHKEVLGVNDLRENIVNVTTHSNIELGDTFSITIDKLDSATEDYLFEGVYIPDGYKITNTSNEEVLKENTHVQGGVSAKE